MKEWTIMVYMAGDNNLSDDMAFSLSEIQEFMGGLADGENEQFNLLAFFDSNSLTAPTQYFDFSEDPQNPVRETLKKEHLHHQPQNNRRRDDQDFQEGNAATSCSILNFVRWCIDTQKKTAKNYAIIFSGHSYGFHGSSFMRDESAGSYLTIFSFRRALEEIIKLYLGKKIDLLGFDSCVMSMLEIGYELKDVAQTMVASEGSIPNSGWSYSPMLKQFIGTVSKTADTPANVKDVAAGFVKSFIDNQNRYTVGGRSVDLAAWDLEKIEPLTETVAALARELSGVLNLPRLAKTNGKLTKKDVLLFEQLKNALLQSHIYCQTYMAEQCVDLKDFCHRLAIECRSLEEQMKLVGYDGSRFTRLKKLCGDVIRAVGECVLKSGFCGDTFQFSNGISMYFPWTALSFAETQFRYRFLRFNKGDGALNEGVGAGSAWNDFLFYYLFVVTLRKKRSLENTDFQAQFNDLVESDLTAGHYTPEVRDNWVLRTRDNWRLGTRDNWRLGTRDNWRLGTRGEMLSYLETFGRFKNYQLDWELSAFSDASVFDEDKLSCGYFDLATDE